MNLQTALAATTNAPSLAMVWFVWAARSVVLTLDDALRTAAEDLVVQGAKSAMSQPAHAAKIHAKALCAPRAKPAETATAKAPARAWNVQMDNSVARECVKQTSATP